MNPHAVHTRAIQGAGVYDRVQYEWEFIFKQMGLFRGTTEDTLGCQQYLQFMIHMCTYTYVPIWVIYMLRYLYLRLVIARCWEGA